MGKISTMIKAKGILKSLETKIDKRPLSKKKKRFVTMALLGSDLSDLITESLLGTNLSIYALKSKEGFVVFENTPICIGYHTYAGTEQKVHILDKQGETLFSVKCRTLLPKVYIFNDSALNF